MSGDAHARAALQQFAPYTFHALQHLIMAMDAVAKNTGKKSIFGRDKGQEAYAKFTRVLAQTLRSLVLDGQVQEADPAESLLEKLTAVVQLFQQGHPNWPDAYLFFNWYLGLENRPNATAVVERLRTAG